MNAMRTASPVLWAPNIGGLVGALLRVFFVLATNKEAGSANERASLLNPAAWLGIKRMAFVCDITEREI